MAVEETPITVKYSSALHRDITGIRSESLACSGETATVAALLGSLGGRYGERFAAMLSHSLVLLNGTAVRDHGVRIPPGATVDIVQLALGG